MQRGPFTLFIEHAVSFQGFPIFMFTSLGLFGFAMGSLVEKGASQRSSLAEALA